MMHEHPTPGTNFRTLASQSAPDVANQSNDGMPNVGTNPNENQPEGEGKRAAIVSIGLAVLLGFFLY